MKSRYFNGKNVSFITSVASFVFAGISLLGALLCVIGKKKTTASIYAALAGVSAAVGALTAYTLKLSESDDYSDVFDGFDPEFDYDDFDEDCEEDGEPYMIPIDDTASEDEFGI